MKTTAGRASPATWAIGGRPVTAVEPPEPPPDGAALELGAGLRSGAGATFTRPPESNAHPLRANPTRIGSAAVLTATFARSYPTVRIHYRPARPRVTPVVAHCNAAASAPDAGLSPP